MKPKKPNSTSKANGKKPILLKSTRNFQTIPQVASSAAPLKKVPSSNWQKESDAALRRLDIDPEDLEALPAITETLISSFGCRPEHLPRKEILNYLACDGGNASRAFLAAYRSIPEHDVVRIPIEAVCLRAKVSPLEILGAVMMSARKIKGQESALKTILRHPEVVGATLDTAMLLGPVGDTSRKMIHDSVGFLPTRSGQSITLNLGQPPKEDGGDSDDDDKAFKDAFPTISGSLEKWADNRRSLTDGR